MQGRSASRGGFAVFESERLVVELLRVGAGEADAFAAAFHEAIEVDAFAAAGAGEALAFVAGKLTGGKWDAHPLFAEEIFVGQFAIGTHLLRVFFELGIEFAGALLGALERDDADGFVSVRVCAEPGVEVDEGGCHLAPVTELECALADPGAGDDADGVGGAAVDLHEDDGTLAVWVELAIGKKLLAGIAYAQALEREHGHAHAEDLSGAEVPVSDLGLTEELV